MVHICSTVMSVHDYWGIRERHGKYSGQLQVDKTKLQTGSYSTVLEAVKNLDRLVTSPPVSTAFKSC